MNAPLPDLLSHRNLPDDMRDALLSRSGDTDKIICVTLRIGQGTQQVERKAPLARPNPTPAVQGA